MVLYFIAIFLICAISVIISSVLSLVGVVSWSQIPYNYFLIGSLLISSLIFKLRFRKIKYFKFFLLRNFVKVNTIFKKVDTKIYFTEVVTLTSMQEKAISLWEACLLDSNSNLLSSFKTSQRQIVTDTILITLSPFTPQESVMTIFDISENRKCLYEVHIPEKYLEDICTKFDFEIQKRIKSIESDRRKAIDDDLDLLLIRQKNKHGAFGLVKENS